ncbi:peptide ABC transporter substrate-binding protein [Goodfellowiella coeruleoviolacea]|uniref:Peptide/nickel transport system substrate-binding protein n=1 Tax=Goodfellowiella coeruleoviolacea TaxID=334858 RepID=A0AAE3KK38_9PSEU|nr:peptide ABC transporter substrate-binding protein [Goodfellowiella coeruleoviolacea]MCP2165023.1 peptide/nickel transport system substrate-binding protein [Goodfellowiella coeruleoviolacea]
MTVSRPRHLTRALALLAVPLLAGLVLTGCAQSVRPHGGGNGVPVEGGSVSFALPPSATPNWILPIGMSGYTASYNSSIQSTMYPRLYAFGEVNGKLTMDEAAGAAKPPVYAADGRSVTITLNHLTWSTGTPVTSRDVEFWLNLIKANKKRWAGYSAGRVPDSITAFETVSADTFVLHLDKPYNQDWFTANQLTLITPLPQAVWDRTSADGPVGDFDRTPDGATAVFDQLVAAAKDLGSYGTNPLWQVVAGPFRLAQFTVDGQVTLVRNDRYTGPDPAHLDEVRFETFTSAAAEYNVLRAGGVDYGYLPVSNLGQRALIEAQGYQVTPWNGWAITYIPYNFNNPAMGAVFRQLYVRQAIQKSVDQAAITRVLWRGAATVGYGPVPQGVDSDYLSDQQRANPYPFDLDGARQLLTAHGWRPGDDGIAVCANAGGGADQCGPGVAEGTRLSMHILAESGSTETDGTMQELKSSLSKVGIELTISQQPLNSVLNATVPCQADEPGCDWQLSFFGTQGSWYFPADPTGDRLFATGSSANFGNYSDPLADELITKSTQEEANDAMRDYSAHLATDLPVIWLPNPAYQVSAIDSALRGVSQNPLANMAPQRWYWTR